MAELTKKELLALKKQWAGADMPEDQGDLPDGKYQFKVTEAEIGVSGNGRLQAGMSQEVVGGDDDLVGEVVKTFDGLETPENIGWFKRKLVRLGFKDYDLDDFDTVRELIGEIPGTVYEGQVKHKDGFMNLYVNRVLSTPDEEEEAEEEEGGEEEAAEIEIGDTGTAPYEGEDYACVVKEVGDGETLTVENAEDEDDTWEVDADDFTPDGEEEGEGEEEEGDGEEEESEEEGEEEEGEEGEEEERYYPTLDEIGKMPISKVKSTILDECGLKLTGPKAKDKAFAQELGCTIASIMEDDDHKPSKEALVFCVKQGAKKTPAKTFAALEQQVIDWLSEISSE